MNVIRVRVRVSVGIRVRVRVKILSSSDCFRMYEFRLVFVSTTRCQIESTGSSMDTKNFKVKVKVSYKHV